VTSFCSILNQYNLYEIIYHAVFISLSWSLRWFCASKFPNQFPVRSLKRENYVVFLYVWEFSVVRSSTFKCHGMPHISWNVMSIKFTIFRLMCWWYSFLITWFMSLISSSLLWVYSDVTFVSFTEEKKVEKKVESESEDDDMGFGLFD
jgi:hypothetical protein